MTIRTLASRLGRIRLTACVLYAGLPLAGLGCTQLRPASVLKQDSPVLILASAQEITELPPPRPEKNPLIAWATADTKLSAESPCAKNLPITLDTVFRLAEGQNVKIAMARSRLEEAYAARSLAELSWLPSLNVGPSYYRHDGGISNEDGTLTHSSFSNLFAGMEISGKVDLRDAVFQKLNAERQIWQQRGEIRRISTETLLEAASTYIDLLAARTGETIALSLQEDLDDLRKRAERLVRGAEIGASVEVARIRTFVKATQRTVVELREKQRQASIKLAYLLSLDPDTLLVPVDEKLVPYHLVDATRSVSELVEKSLATGPGIQEMEGLLGLAQEGLRKAEGKGNYLPVFEVRILEGGFGSGPGDSQRWDNRVDVGLQAKWNLVDVLTAGDRKRQIRAKADQVHLAFQDLRAKLSAGVQEARDSIVHGREQLRLAEDQLKEARRAFELSDNRLKNNAPGSSFSEVLQSLQSVALAQSGYVTTLRSYDQAQMRLMVFLGEATESNCSIPPAK